ncbi:MAG: 1-acyl-sn-glycerol-3-phosphate acyltransferase [Anaeroplasma bactoclasticum]|nr:1-acyl-sn-glycerol-3-phosphate acyltransferase [Anaeroplasma bactoclasticum]
MIKLISVVIAMIVASIGCHFVPTTQSFMTILVWLGLCMAAILVQVILFFLVAFIVGIPIRRKKETLHYNSFYRWVMYWYTRCCLSVFNVKIVAKGLEKLPQDGPFVIVSNHLSNVDSMVMDVLLKDFPLVFVTKESLFHIPFFGKIIHGIGYLKLERGNLRKEVVTIKKGISFLNQGECSIGVYPEGTRNFTSEILLPFKPGCFHLATKTQKPIVVCVTTGTEQIKYHPILKKHKVTFQVIDVIEAKEYQGLTTREIGEKISQMMIEELGKYERKNATQ